MDNNSSTKALVESGVLTGVAVILMLISLYIPVISMVTLFIWPLPITLIYIRHNIKYSVLSLIATALITAMVSDPISALWFTLIFGIISVVMGYCIKSKKSSTTTMLYMGIVNFICIIAVFYGFTALMGLNLIGQFKATMEEYVKIINVTYTELGMPKETIDQFIKMFDINKLMKLLPGTLVMGSGTISFITYSVAKLLFKRFGYILKEVRKFSEWYIPFKVATGIFLFIIIGYLLNLKKIGVGESLLLNSVSIFRIIFVIIGLSSAAYFLKKKGIAKGIIIVILIFAAMSPLANIVELIGLVDYALDLRKLDNTRVRFSKPQ